MSLPDQSFIFCRIKLNILPQRILTMMLKLEHFSFIQDCGFTAPIRKWGGRRGAINVFLI